MMDAVTPEELRKLTASLEAEKQRRDLRANAAADFAVYAENFLRIFPRARVTAAA